MKTITTTLLLFLFNFLPLPKNYNYVPSKEILEKTLNTLNEDETWILLPLAESVENKILMDMGKAAPLNFEQYIELIENHGFTIKHSEVQRELIHDLPTDFHEKLKLTEEEAEEFKIRFRTSNHLAKRLLIKTCRNTSHH